MSYSLDVYNEIIEQKLIHGKGSKPKSWEELCRGTKLHINCCHAVSIYLQRKGCLKKGKIVGHTTRGKYKNKNSKSKAISGWKNLKNCDIKYVGKTFNKLPSKYKKNGIVFVYDSDIAVYNNGYILSCSSSGNRMSKKNVYHKTGYQFTHKILFVIIPK